MTDTNAREQFDAAAREIRTQRVNVLNAIRAVQRSRSLPDANVGQVLQSLGLPTYGTEVNITLPNADHLSDNGLRHHTEELIRQQTTFRQNVQRVIGEAQRRYPSNISNADVQPVFQAAGIQQAFDTTPADPWAVSSSGASRTVTITANVSGSTEHDAAIEREVRNLAGRAGLTVHEIQVVVRNIA